MLILKERNRIDHRTQLPRAVEAKVAMKGNRLVVGLDYGTTYTGVSYCETSDTSLIEKHIEVVNNWPSRHTKIGTKEKVPSEIAYLPDGVLWGSLIPTNVTRHMWTKLQLDRPQEGEAAKVIEEQQLAAYFSNKQPVDIIADFLTHVKDHLLRTLDEEYRREIWVTLSITLVVTVPAVWSDAAKDRTLQAVRQAGFNTTCFPHLKRTILATEPEAAAIYTIKTLRGTTQDQQLAIDDGFIICDMGGGTVDLISYRVAELQPTVVEEATVGTGDQCGGSFIDRAFLRWLERRLGAEDFFKIAGCRSEDIPRTSLASKLGRMVQDFNLEAKSGFSGIESNFLRLPAPLNAIEEDTARGISDGEILITPKDMIDMFEYPVRRTYELVLGQILQARQICKGELKYLFMVGGFSESPYMYSKVKDFAAANSLKTVRPAYAWSAVVRGAAAKGLEGDGRPPIRNRKCRRHYGTGCTQSFIGGKHREADSFICPFSGTKMARKQISWHLRKGQDLSTSALPHAKMSMFSTFWSHEIRTVEVSLWATDTERAPNRQNGDVYEVAKLSVDLTNVPAHKFKSFQNKEKPSAQELQPLPAFLQPTEEWKRAQRQIERIVELHYRSYQYLRPFSTKIMMASKALQLAAVGDLDNEKRVRILGVIDKLRELGVSENVSLPQVSASLGTSEAVLIPSKLVVIGDQSSGKSSLLEGLTGLSFPIASDLCTRFATQIVLRRAPANEAEVRITIIPGPDAQGDEETLDYLLAFERTFSAEEFDEKRFQEIFDEASIK
ncbi:hypothetical protein N0V83_010687 [Neocucurbitaria cava]|uniref:Dynamin N-terminal domain-containing protein n=1 Tax=Neocucurbitaria cava TaxID=798079 RepID=A0A9W8XZ80_9PLEO|nr:hypothetical protein N0V83_010687 [Neocucurbitaria cava]